MRDHLDFKTLDWLSDYTESLGVEQNYLNQIELSKPKDIPFNNTDIVEFQLELKLEIS